MPRQPRKEYLLETAYRLFNAHGFHATGIDRILAESGVSKATLYKYFRTKEGLILEVLKRRNEALDAMLEFYIQRFQEEQPGQPPQYAVLVIFDALHDWINSDHFYGCNFINASAEYGAADDPVHCYAAQYKEAFRAKLVSLLAGLKPLRREALADQLMILMDGAIVVAQVSDNRNSALTAKQVAAVLIELG